MKQKENIKKYLKRVDEIDDVVSMLIGAALDEGKNMDALDALELKASLTSLWSTVAEVRNRIYVLCYPD